MVKKVIVTKIHTDKDFEKFSGENFNKKYYKKIFKKGDIDCYWKDSDGKEHILFKVRRKVIPEDLQQLVFKTFLSHSKKVNDQRSVASGNQKRKWDKGVSRSNVSIRSNISGYFDTPYMQIQKHFKTKTVCRTTAFTRKNLEKWKSTIPFFELIAKQYKNLAPEQYKKQMNLFKKCPPGFQIGKTPFTTVTSNYNWRTACHKDKGDFEQGMGNLTVLGSDFEGGYLGFPQFGVAVDVRPRDTAIMDVHQWHCNTELKVNDTDKIRLSFVTYFREKMVNCDKKKIINGETYYYKSN